METHPAAGELEAAGELDAARAAAEENPPVETDVKETKAKKAKKTSAPRKPKNPPLHPPYFEVIRLHFV